MNRATIARMLIPGLDLRIKQAYNDVVKECEDLYEKRTSKRNFEEHLVIGSFGRAAEKLEGNTIRFDSLQELYTQRYVHQTVGLGYVITQEAFDDNIYEEKGKLFSTELGRAMAETKETRAANYFNLAFTAANGPDGKPMIASDHPTTHAGNFSNLLAGDLSEQALETAIIKIKRQTDDRGNLTGAVAKRLVIPTTLMFEARKFLDSDLTTSIFENSGNSAATNQNAINALGRAGVFPGGVKIVSRLTDDTAWFIQTDAPGSTIMYQRKPLETSDDMDNDRGIIKHRVQERYSFGHTNFRGWYGSPGA